MIDDLLKLPLSERWHQGAHFAITMEDGAVNVHAAPLALALALPLASAADPAPAFGDVA